MNAHVDFGISHSDSLFLAVRGATAFFLRFGPSYRLHFGMQATKSVKG